MPTPTFPSSPPCNSASTFYTDREEDRDNLEEDSEEEGRDNATTNLEEEAHLVINPRFPMPNSDYPGVDPDEYRADRLQSYIKNRPVTVMSENTCQEFGFRAQQVGKVRAEASRAHIRRKPPRPRRSWTPQETGALELYIRHWGSAWADIKRYDDGKKFGQSFLSTRSQPDLKDKAQNIKYSMLRGGYYIPAKFRLIKLNAVKKELLRTTYGVTDFCED
jgi:hypothetical protein